MCVYEWASVNVGEIFLSRRSESHVVGLTAYQHFF